MSVVDYLPGRTKDTAPSVLDETIKKRIARGREAMMKDATKRRLLFRFWRGDQYCWVDDKKVLQFLPTETYVNGGKPPHRVRTTRNFIKPRVQAKVSAATNRTPGYDISPATTDPEDYAGARLSQKAALYGFDKWGVRVARIKTVTNALVADGGFAMPYFDPNVGPFHLVDGKWVGEGEIKIAVFHGNQVGWEPGMDFDESPWHVVWRARSIPEIMKTPGYIGGKLKPDATTSDVPTDRPSDELALVGEYFERPCADYPEGRKLTIANDREIRPEERYPCRDPQGNVVDEPVLHHLVWTIDPDRDRGMGLVEDLVDANRTINDAFSKISEYKNRVLVPQIMAPVGAMKEPPTDEPGRVNEYYPQKLVGGQPPTWEIRPPIPQELFQIVDQNLRAMDDISASANVDAAANVAARTVQQVIEQAQNQWATFLAALAEFDSSLMRHCLNLAAVHYSEPRLLKIRGRTGWESIPDFRGADMRGQTDVRVLPDSLIAKTRQGIKEEIQFFVSMFPGVFSPEAVMAAWHGGLGESLLLNYEEDLAACAEVIKAIVAGPDVLFSKPPQVRSTTDPTTGQMQMQEVPWWMPGPSANVRVWKDMYGTWLKSAEARELDAPMSQAAHDVYDALLKLEADESARQAAMQSQIAANQGMVNAAAPQGPKPLPSQPAMDGASGP